MFITPDKMPGSSRIWIYQSDRRFLPEEISRMSILAKEFLETWTAHNNELKASFEIRHDLFLILMIDSSHADASGCSIDKSVHFIQRLEKEFSMSLLNRQIYAIREGDEIKLIRRKDFEQQLEKEISNDTPIFNNLVETKKDLENNWEVPIRESWHGTIRI